MRTAAIALALSLAAGHALAGCEDEGHAMRKASLEALLSRWQFEATRDPAKVTITDAYKLAFAATSYPRSKQPWSTVAIDALFKSVIHDAHGQSSSEILTGLLLTHYGSEHPERKDEFAKSWAAPLSAIISGKPPDVAQLRMAANKAQLTLDQARANYYDCRWQEIETKKPEDSDEVLSALEEQADYILTPAEFTYQRGIAACAESDEHLGAINAAWTPACLKLETYTSAMADALRKSKELQQSLRTTEGETRPILKDLATSYAQGMESYQQSILLRSDTFNDTKLHKEALLVHPSPCVDAALQVLRMLSPNSRRLQFLRVRTETMQLNLGKFNKLSERVLKLSHRLGPELLDMHTSSEIMLNRHKDDGLAVYKMECGRTDLENIFEELRSVKDAVVANRSGMEK